MRSFRGLFWAACLAPCCALAEIDYSIKLDRAMQSIRVSIHVDHALPQQEFRIPAWCPGFYFLENYQDQIRKVSAANDDGHPLTVTHSEPRAWTVSDPDGGPITLSYDILGNEPGLGFFAVNVRPYTLFINGAGAFMFLPDRLNEKDKLDVDLPKGWDTATGMERDEDGHLSAGSYDEFIDHPLQFGAFKRETFKVQNVPFEAIFVSPDNRYPDNLKTEADALRRASLPALKMFGAAPFKHYTYIIHLAEGEFPGGLEHRASNVIAVANAPELHIEDLAAHEYFHAWNVKQIRPKVLGPFDYAKPVRTKNLWFAEGVTDYYSKIHTYQAGLADVHWLFGQISENIAKVEASASRHEKTLEQASWECWENGGFGVGDLSYYDKGFVVAFLLDIKLRSGSQGAHKLEDVMRYMYGKYHLPEPGYEEDGILNALNHVAGEDLTLFYNQLVRSTDDLPYDVLAGVGLKAQSHRNSNGDLIWTLDPDDEASIDARALLSQFLSLPNPG